MYNIEFDELYQGYEEWLDEQAKLNPWEDQHAVSNTEDTEDICDIQGISGVGFESDIDTYKR